MHMRNRSTAVRINQFIHWIIFIGVFFFGALTSLARTQPPPESIRLHASMSMGDGHLSLTLLTKGQHKLRASIQDPQHKSKVHITYNQEQLWTKPFIHGSESARKLEGTEAAENLLDLLALNPQFHFKQRDGFNLSSSALKGYKVEYTQSEKPYKETNKHVPESLKLFDISKDEPRLIRSIRYISFQKSTTPFVRPKELVLTDETTSESGTIIINEVSYNSGIPDFIFKLPESN
jgi:hypothetical protein